MFFKQILFQESIAMEQEFSSITSFNQDSSFTFSKMYVFGDSLSDQGNIFNLTTSVQPIFNIPVIPGFPYFEGRFSNGLVWVENLATDLGLTIIPSTELSAPQTFLASTFNGATTTQSVNFAYGGAQTGTEGAGDVGNFIPGVLTQVQFFIDDHQEAEQLADPEALYIIWAGPNDYQTIPDANPETVVDNIETAITSLFDLGGRNFLVPNLPDLGQVPIAQVPDNPVSTEQLTNLTQQHNLLLEETLDELSGSLIGINLIPLEIDELFNNIVTNPEEFGFTNISEPCLNSNPIDLANNSTEEILMNLGTCTQPDERLFWDQLHITASAQDILGEFALEALTPQSEFIL